jgi:ribosomal protein L40E
MAAPVSFDILFLGLKDASPPGRKRCLNAIWRLTGNPEQETRQILAQPSGALFTTLDRESAQLVIEVLEDAGVRVEIRPTDQAHDGVEQQLWATQRCAGCNFVNPADSEECHRCGLVFAKWERESVRQMQRDRQLEEAVNRAQQLREEWTQKAKGYVEERPLPAEAFGPFADSLLQEEICFQGLNSEEGPLLMTSRRLLFLRDGTIGSLPYEFIADVDVGGGLVKVKDHVRLQLTFHTPLPQQDGTGLKNISWQLDKESSFFTDVVMDWAFARNFLCGSCGERDLDFRAEGAAVRFRCMHCATDHEINWREAVSVPLVDN